LLVGGRTQPKPACLDIRFCFIGDRTPPPSAAEPAVTVLVRVLMLLFARNYSFFFCDSCLCIPEHGSSSNARFVFDSNRAKIDFAAGEQAAGRERNLGRPPLHLALFSLRRSLSSSFLAEEVEEVTGGTVGEAAPCRLRQLPGAAKPIDEHQCPMPLMARAACVHLAVWPMYAFV
jgi:hypothetical protein